MKKFLNLQLFTDLVLFFIEALFLYQSIYIHRNAFNDPNVWGDMGTVPGALAYVMIALTLIDFIRNIVKSAKSTPVEKTKEEKKGAWFAIIEIAMIALYSFAIQWIGYIIATIALLVGTMLLFRCRDWKLLVFVPVGVTAGLFCLFRYVLTIMLPTLFL